MTKLYPQGSEWRKWDLHVHPPGTKLSDDYGKGGTLVDYCRFLEESDVAAFGITDYFSVDATFAFLTRFQELHPNSKKVFFPNIELRLTETVNGAQQTVHMHLVFRPEVERATLDQLLGELKTQITASTGRHKRCNELDANDFVAAMVTRQDVKDALKEVFGEKHPTTDNVIIVIPANNDGIRASSGQTRRAYLADEIDKMSHAVYGNSGNSDYFLKNNRFEDGSQRSIPKPVFAGCDAHSFDQLTSWLGRAVDEKSTRKQITWIKADPTFEGLQQTLVEPADRVRIQDTMPDPKEPYKVISGVRFSGTNEFPDFIPLNPNLVSIIGSRSSGKSALLAYIAHAVDPDYTVRQQVDSGAMERGKAGPAAAKTWRDVSSIQCVVEWGGEESATGKVIYIPQNSLFAVSERPGEITEKIQPALYRLDPDLRTVHERAQADVRSANTAIWDAVHEWFRLSDRLTASTNQLRDLGDQRAVESTRDQLAQKIAALRAASSLSEDDVTAYQSVVDQLSATATTQTRIQDERAALAPYVRSGETAYETAGVDVEVLVTPPTTTFPPDLAATITAAAQQAEGPLNEQIRGLVTDYRLSLDQESERLQASSAELRSANADLIQRNQLNTELEELVTSHNKQVETLKTIAGKVAEATHIEGERTAQVQVISDELARRHSVVDAFASDFGSQDRVLDGMAFGVEQQDTEESLRTASAPFDRRENSEYFDRSSEIIDIGKARQAPAAFLEAIGSSAQRLKQNEASASAAAAVLTTTPELRFFATLEGDRIGGFQRSSMTPGKQALFALTLILNESTEAWPLLIDQPEDDLDSRSVYDTIVPYLVKRKHDRQILMVTHNANLVVGADSEQIIVANRHADDRKNRDDRAFAFMTGSLEHTQEASATQYVLESRGVREHTCEILDGGVVAFQKRKDKYKL